MKKNMMIELLGVQQRFEQEYKETLYRYDLSEEQFNVLYALGAVINHALYEIADLHREEKK